MTHNTLVAKYSYRVTWSPRDGAFIASVDEWPSLKAHGDTAVQAVEEILAVVDACVADMIGSGEELPTPNSEVAHTVLDAGEAISAALQTICEFQSPETAPLGRFRAGEYTVVVTRAANLSELLNGWYDDLTDQGYGEKQ